eukprot:GFUD01025457.1.p1 GENE.GFUD01025457.1~~GFUD01025457.1.p1  ORF type:complete len:432 (-),score=65.91 GFUD01025457.1:167-1462(-)
MFPDASKMKTFMEVENVDCLMQDLRVTYRNELYTDVSFELTDGVTIASNRFMLASRSDYFAGMLYGGLKESTSDKVKLKCDSKIFRLILDYVWEAKVDYSQLGLKPLLDLMENARLMCFDRLAGGIEEHLKVVIQSEEIDIQECLVLLEFCVGNKFEELGNLVLRFVDLHFGNVCSEDFSQLSESSVFAILKYEERSCLEKDVLNALIGWIGSQTTLDSYTKEKMLSLVDLVMISRGDLFKVRKTSLFEDKAIFDALEEQFDLEDVIDVNVALAKTGAKLVAGNPIGCNSSCLREPPHNYDDGSGYTFNKLGQRVTVELSKEYVINKIGFLLWDRDDRSYSYTLEYSLDGITWSIVLDCREMSCKSMQTIFFGRKRMKFISVSGTRNTYGYGYAELEIPTNRKTFHIVNFSATLDLTTSPRKNSGMEPIEL